MNNERRQSLKNQVTILRALGDVEEVSVKTYDKIKMRMSETEDLLNPKEDVPYEDSLEDNRICPDCKGLIRIRNPTGKCDHLYYPENKFVKSSKGEKNGNN